MTIRIFNAILPYSHSRVPHEAATEWVNKGEMTGPIACICICGQPHKWMNVWKNIMTGQQRPIGRTCTAHLEKAIDAILAREQSSRSARLVRAGYRRDDFVVEDDEVDEVEEPEVKDEAEPEDVDSDPEWEPEPDVKAQDDQDGKYDWKDLPANQSMASSSWDVKRVISRVGDHQLLVQWWPSGVNLRQLLQAQELWGNQIVEVDQRGNRYVITWQNQIIPVVDYEPKEEI